MRSPLARVLLAAACTLSAVADARADEPRPDRIVRVLGARTASVYAPRTGTVGALVALPRGVSAASLGLEEVTPSIARLRATPEVVARFAESHPSLRIEVGPTLKLLNDRVGQFVRVREAAATRGADGEGAWVGVADTGIDADHPDTLDEAGRTRIAWVLDLSKPPAGVHPELEERFGIRGPDGRVSLGAVLSAADIDALRAIRHSVPTDEIGHGTHVTATAAGSGGASGTYAGVAPRAGIVAVRVTRDTSQGIENDDLVRAVQFMFDRADAAKKPIAVNISLGSDFGSHDGSALWEQTIASFVGPDKPGHAIVAAAGNSGSVAELPIHQNVHVPRGVRMRVPVVTQGASSGAVQIWVNFRPGAQLDVGLEGPDGVWIDPVPEGAQAGRTTADFSAGVIHGAGQPSSPIVAGARGAVIVWTGRWPAGDYHVVLQGEGTADLYLQGIGDAAITGRGPAAFAVGVREGTVNLPATHPSIIGVGCTVNRVSWTSFAGAEVAIRQPRLDAAGGLPLASARGERLEEGDVCWFSSAGPNSNGVPKPEIAAPGAAVVSAMSGQAKPGTRGSIFTNEGCPEILPGRVDTACLQVDRTHAVSIGTSMSSPVVAGVIALLFQRDPTLTQDKIVALLQGGAHYFRGRARFFDQSGPGEVDAVGALLALDRMSDPAEALPDAASSWLTLSADHADAVGRTPLTAIVELRTASGQAPADFFDARRLVADVRVDGEPVAVAPPTRRGPGVWTYEILLPPGHGGGRLTAGALFDGAPIVAARTVPVATDRWTATYPSIARGGGCAVTPSGRGRSGLAALVLATALVGSALARRRLFARVR